MRIQNNVSSKNYNSFQIDVDLDCLIEIQDFDDLDDLDIITPFYILGGGSNILMLSDVSRPMVHIDIKGKEILMESESYVLVKVGAGENWHQTVLWAIDNNYGGIENLSLIPGRCGAAPMQNIGAYGVEIKDVLHSVYVFDVEDKLHKILHASECNFAYRSSNFKTIWKDKFIITAIVLQLAREGYHTINSSYGAINAKLAEKNISDPSIRQISDAVIEIRSSKLPDPKKIGNAGSFFKNPIIDREKHESMVTAYPNMPSYPSGDKIKLAAGWLIDQCGWKGYRDESGAGSHKDQALVLVNHGTASGRDILAIAKKIKQSVKEKFGVELEEEVNIWDQ